MVHMRAYTPVLFCFAALLTGCAATTEQAGPAVRLELQETYWRPVEIEGRPVVIHAGTREPHVILRREGARINGYTGCNTLAGGFKHDGTRLNFGKLIMTRMACLPEAGHVLEAAFVKALHSTASYRIIGESLELRDAAGMTRMRLEARPVR